MRLFEDRRVIGERMSGVETFFDLVTLAHWPMVLVVGLIGFAAMPNFVIEAKKDPTEVTLPPVERVQIELSAASVPEQRGEELNKPAGAPPPPLEDAPQLPTVPNLVQVADRSQVAFALPVEGAHELVALSQAAHTVSGEGREGSWERTEIVRLTFGHGEGRQPAPRYPYKAQQQLQEGRVGVRFVVGENGRVQSAEVTKPCEWRLLNQAARKTIEDRWRFAKGTVRNYEVFLDFKLYR